MVDQPEIRNHELNFFNEPDRYDSNSYIARGGISAGRSVALYWPETRLARVYLTRDTHGSVSQIDLNHQDQVKFTGDNLSWFGEELMLISSAAWKGPIKDANALK